MVPEIKKILYATDLSESARHAFGYAARLASRFDAPLTILHVIENVNPSIKMQIQSYLGEKEWDNYEKRAEQSLLDDITARLNNFCSQMNLEMPSCQFIVEKIIVLRGVPAEEIMKQAGDNACDLIVMGTHGYGLFADALMGGTARRVVRRSQVPVLVVRLPKGEDQS
jgi:nucleotide-binding universal stress UspA family protein